MAVIYSEPLHLACAEVTLYFRTGHLKFIQVFVNFQLMVLLVNFLNATHNMIGLLTVKNVKDYQNLKNIQSK